MLHYFQVALVISEVVHLLWEQIQKHGHIDYIDKVKIVLSILSYLSCLCCTRAMGESSECWCLTLALGTFLLY